MSPLETPADVDGSGHDPRTTAQRRADAIVELGRLCMRGRWLPVQGAATATLVVKLDFDTLTGQVGCGVTEQGVRLSAGAVRRMACDANILPVVLGGRSEILDLGRTQRLATGPLRQALDIRDGGCAFPGCDRGVRWTQAHHIASWLHNGPTDLDNMVLLCGEHHRTIHHTDWQVWMGDDRRPEFIPPRSLDPLQRPRRNHH
jgi:hypothetical protein